ncbi:hypothetical protein F5Y19DRAFT_470697 [Xylariaceae sp. FL1651]|nr:hypothetical protein F5Y19DRAFT_470697 [Xylariaceae sp. FL1651]
MHTRRLLPSLILPAVALSLPSSPVGTPTQALTPKDVTSPSCELYDFPSTPTNPPECWAWFAATTPSNYCGDSTFSPVPASSASAAYATAKNEEWLRSCGTLRERLLSDPGDYFLADYTTEQYNTLITSVPPSGAGCALQVQPATAPSSDQIYVGGTDLTDIIGSAMAVSWEQTGGIEGVEGVMSCGGDAVRWRMVPL